MRILLVTDVIHAGGAETFVLRLAEALKTNGQKPFLFILRRDKIDYKLKRNLAPNVPLISPAIPFFALWSKIDALLFRLKFDFSFLRWFQTHYLKKAIGINRIQIVHSHLFTSDLVSVEAAKIRKIPIISTLHGDYYLYSSSRKARTISRILNYEQKLARVLKAITGFVCITDEQMLQLKDLQYRYNIQKKLVKIYNGYTVNEINRPVSREDLNIDRDAFIIGMVARGIKEKGWVELIQAFLDCDLPNSQLVLVGGGEFLDEIKGNYKQRNIHFIGSVTNPIEYIRLFDLAALPSYFESESLPTVIIEYLFSGKPVLATRKGEIPEMLSDDTAQACGITIPISSPDGMISSLSDALVKLYNDQHLLHRFAVNTSFARQKFAMELCVNSYLKFYRSVS